MFGVALSAASAFLGKVPSKVWKTLGLTIVGFVIGIMFAFKFLVPPPSIEYITRVVEAQRELTEVVVSHARRESAIRIVREVIEKEVIKYVPLPQNDLDCNIPIGSVRLLNDARVGEIRKDGLSGTTSPSDEEGRAASTVSRGELIQSDAAIALQYNQLKVDHDALIDWINVQQAALDQ